MRSGGAWIFDRENAEKIAREKQPEKNSYRKLRILATKRWVMKQRGIRRCDCGERESRMWLQGWGEEGWVDAWIFSGDARRRDRHRGCRHHESCLRGCHHRRGMRYLSDYRTTRLSGCLRRSREKSIHYSYG